METLLVAAAALLGCAGRDPGRDVSPANSSRTAAESAGRPLAVDQDAESVLGWRSKQASPRSVEPGRTRRSKGLTAQRGVAGPVQPAQQHRDRPWIVAQAVVRGKQAGSVPPWASASWPRRCGTLSIILAAMDAAEPPASVGRKPAERRTHSSPNLGKVSDRRGRGGSARRKCAPSSGGGRARPSAWCWCRSPSAGRRSVVDGARSHRSVQQSHRATSWERAGTKRRARSNRRQFSKDDAGVGAGRGGRELHRRYPDEGAVRARAAVLSSCWHDQVYPTGLDQAVRPQSCCSRSWMGASHSSRSYTSCACRRRRTRKSRRRAGTREGGARTREQYSSGELARPLMPVEPHPGRDLLAR